MGIVAPENLHKRKSKYSLRRRVTQYLAFYRWRKAGHHWAIHVKTKMYIVGA